MYTWVNWNIIGLDNSFLPIQYQAIISCDAHKGSVHQYFTRKESKSRYNQKLRRKHIQHFNEHFVHWWPSTIRSQAISRHSDDQVKIQYTVDSNNERGSGYQEKWHQAIT